MKARLLALDFKRVWPVLLQAVIEHEFANQDVADKMSEIFRAQTKETLYTYEADGRRRWVDVRRLQ